MKNNLTKIILVCCLAIIPLIAQKASIRGVVTDAKTGNPLIGVNIMLKGTYYGAATDINGSYIISGMGPGSYDMQVSMMGYKQLIHGGITLRKGESKRMDLKLEPTVLALGEDVVVVGDKPIIDAA